MISTARALTRTFLGKREWIRFRKAICLSDKDFVYVMLDDDCISVLLKNVEVLKREIGSGRLVLVVNTRKNYNMLNDISDAIHIYRMSLKGMERMAYYTIIFERIRNMQILSLDVPFGRNGSMFVDLKGLSKEEIITIGLFDLPMKSDRIVR